MVCFFTEIFLTLLCCSFSLQHNIASLQPLQVNSNLILVKSIPSCQPTVYVCQKTLNHPLNHVCC